MTALLLTTAQAAEQLSVSKVFLDTLRVTGGGPKFLRLKGRGKGGHIIRYTPEALAAWVAAQPSFTSTTQADAARRAS